MSELWQYDEDHRRRRAIRRLGGVDEAGRGPLAGPVVAGAVILRPEARLEGVNDSKKLKAAQREGFVGAIIGAAQAYGVGLATAEEVDRVNVLAATHLAAGRALGQFGVQPEFLVTDYLKLRAAPCPIHPIAKGDSTSLAVAAASILAKVARDRLMTLLDAEYPQYGFARHKGYGTAAHRAAIAEHGPSTIHRMSFGGVSSFNEEPTVRSRRAMAGGLAGERPEFDARDLLAEDWRATPIESLLPEIEFRAQVSA